MLVDRDFQELRSRSDLSVLRLVGSVAVLWWQQKFPHRQRSKNGRFQDSLHQLAADSLFSSTFCPKTRHLFNVLPVVIADEF